ncbi:MAG: cytochrome P460 family protein [Gammaproteobacteria bacterium]|nr:cytochrome P460 family protein [Gammaproteobacteria bacterium]
MIRRILKPLFGAAALALFVVATLAQGASYDETYQKYVKSDGSIVVPSDYRTELVFVGTFSVAGGDEQGGQAEFHQVYMDRDSIEHYRRTGEFPDGAIIVKELQNVRALDMTTGHASSWKKDAGWFLMIKDAKGRFPGHGSWGDGWGWALFAASDRMQSTTKDYKAECIGCHLPAKRTDWVHVWAYPLLGAEERFADFNP